MKDQECKMFDGINPENLEFLESCFQKFEESTLDSSWKGFFKKMEKGTASPEIIHELKKLRIERAIQTFRTHGYIAVEVSSLPIKEKLEDRFTFEKLGFSHDEEDELFPTCGILHDNVATLKEILNALRGIYVSRIGIEYFPFVSDEIASWIQARFEMLGGRIPFGKEQKREIFKNLAQAEIFESFLHMKFIGQKRFSLEGGESLVPMLSFLTERAPTHGIDEFVIGMSHRGRLNVVSHVLRKTFQEVLLDFHEVLCNDDEESGDVKYHKGFSNVIKTSSGKDVKMTMPSNPSHLESVDPVISGFVRGHQQQNKDERREKIVPIIIHGDAAISGQGVVYETLQLSRLSGFTIGGTIHIVINNHIGFTALPKDCRSTRFCTDIAKSFGVPVFHVNAEDPEACVWAALSALELRQQLHRDVFIELNCYRKYGHNEGDEPAYTQPKLYSIIRKKKSIKELYRESIINEGILTDEIAKGIENEYLESLKKDFEKTPKYEPVSSSASTIEKSHHKKITSDELINIGERVLEIPKGFNVHQKLKKSIEDKKKELVEKKENFSCDWSFGETLALGVALSHGVSVRLVGQDSRRGTFSQRHAVWIDQDTEQEYYPLRNVLKNGDSYEVYDSLLSEFAVLGYEYGYSIGYHKSLNLWEAQFGDFVNEAQVIIDQYLVSGETKWGVTSQLVLLLPHGFEGQGPEHSSAYMERFLQLAADDNIIISAPTTPAQYFGVLIRQAFGLVEKKPLILFTPKGLLRHPECVSSIKSLGEDGFREIIDDNLDKSMVTKILLCQGRIYYDIIAERRAVANTVAACIRIEQLYPFKSDILRNIFIEYPKVQEIIWVQEEPKNRGAWRGIKDKIQAVIPSGMELKYIGRQESSSPAAGSHERHAREHKEIMKSLF